MIFLLHLFNRHASMMKNVVDGWVANNITPRSDLISASLFVPYCVPFPGMIWR